MTHAALRPSEPIACPLCGTTFRTDWVWASGERALRCGTCDIRTIEPKPTPDRIAAHYSGYVGTNTPPETIARLAEVSRRYLLRLSDDFGIPSSPRYLEIGFGNGASLLAAASLGWDCTGVDLDQANVSRVRQLAAEWGGSVRVRQGAIEEVEATHFDVVRASQVIEHVLDPRAFLGEAALRQGPGGVLVVDCPNDTAAFWLLKNALRGVFNRNDFHNSLRLQEHLWGFSPKSLTRLLGMAGYRVAKCGSFPVGSEVQPETNLWYPDLAAGVRASAANRSLYPLARACIRTFDRAAHAIDRGMGLLALATRAPA